MCSSPTYVPHEVASRVCKQRENKGGCTEESWATAQVPTFPVGWIQWHVSEHVAGEIRVIQVSQSTFSLHHSFL